VANPIKHRDTVLLAKIGDRIRDFRVKKGFSQSEFANRCDVELSTINRIELGKASPSLTLLFIMAKELKITASDLINIKL
jgi:transcriptional regulator with XRE-family HTH domain